MRSPEVPLVELSNSFTDMETRRGREKNISIASGAEAEMRLDRNLRVLGPCRSSDAARHRTLHVIK